MAARFTDGSAGMLQTGLVASLHVFIGIERYWKQVNLVAIFSISWRNKFLEKLNAGYLYLRAYFALEFNLHCLTD